MFDESETVDIVAAKPAPWHEARWVKATAKTVGTAVSVTADLGPLVVALRHGSHPIAWAVTGLALAKKVWQHIPKRKIPVNPNPWPSVSFQGQYAFYSFLIDNGCGELKPPTPSSKSSGTVEYVHRGVTWGVGPGKFVNPDGSTKPLVAWIWDHFQAIDMVKNTTSQRQLRLLGTKKLDLLPPSNRAVRIGDECAALKRDGFRVGVLIDGEPGTGKSVTARYVAACLGGRALRASLTEVSPWDLLQTATMLRPDAVIMDDIDRSNTHVALDAVERLISAGISVIATSNNKDEICTAMLRAGRIDQHYVFTGVEEDVLANILAGHDLPSQVVAELQRHTIARVSRFLEFNSSLGLSRALTFLRMVAPQEPIVLPESISDVMRRGDMDQYLDVIGRTQDEMDAAMDDAPPMCLAPCTSRMMC